MSSPRRLVAIVVVAALAIGWFVARGGSEPDFGGAKVPADALAAGAPEGAAVAAKPSKAPIETIEVFASKDPFEALVADGSGSGGAGLVVKLVRVSGNAAADVSIDGTLYEAQVGKVFAHSFELTSIDGDCVSVLYGDDQFSVCEGDQIVK